MVVCFDDLEFRENEIGALRALCWLATDSHGLTPIFFLRLKRISALTVASTHTRSRHLFSTAYCSVMKSKDQNQHDRRNSWQSVRIRGKEKAPKGASLHSIQNSCS
jgi:hypothetical protein